MPEPVLLTDDDGQVRRLTLNRPAVLNALSTELVDALSRALADAATNEEVRVVVIRGAGRAFCAGYDLKDEAAEQAAHGSPDIVALRAELVGATERMLEVFDHPKPVIAQVHGYCLGGGCDLMTMCDLTIAADDALFGEPEVKFGSAVVSMTLPWLIGARRAKELLLTGEDRLGAEEALRIGLVNRVVGRDELDGTTIALARRIAALDPVAVAFTKRAVNRALDVAGFREALRAGAELAAMVEAAEVPERREFNRIRAADGLRAAIAWRDARAASKDV